MAGCGSDSGGSPTAPSANVPYSTTDLRVGTGAEATSGRSVVVNYTGWLYSTTAANNKGTQFDSGTFPFVAGSNQAIAGFSRASQGNDKGARKLYEKAIRYNGDLILAHRELALSSVRLGALDDARATLESLKQRAATCAETCAQAADIKSAISAIEAALAAPESATPATPETTDKRGGQWLPDSGTGDRAYTDAVALINEGRYDAAIAHLQHASMALGPHPDILTYLGFAHRKQGNYDLAERYYRRALAIAPRHVGATEYYGELMVERGDLVGASRMLARLERYCDFGCAEADELRRWIERAERGV